MIMTKIAIIQIRTLCKARRDVVDTLRMLHLSRKQHCSVYDESPQLAGMLDKIKDVATFGPVSEKTYQLLCEKRGEKDPRDPEKVKNLFRLHPPRGGYERKGIKIPASVGGALGRRDSMDALIVKML